MLHVKTGTLFFLCSYTLMIIELLQYYLHVCAFVCFYCVVCVLLALFLSTVMCYCGVFTIVILMCHIFFLFCPCINTLAICIYVNAFLYFGINFLSVIFWGSNSAYRLHLLDTLLTPTLPSPPLPTLTYPQPCTPLLPVLFPLSLLHFPLSPSSPSFPPSSCLSSILSAPLLFLWKKLSSVFLNTVQYLCYDQT